MSESESEIEKYRTTTGVDSKYADVASDDHALKDRFGSDEDAKKIEFEAEVIGERVAQWYDDPAAAIREYLSNAETACIRRAKQELLEAGHEPPSGVSDILADAKETVGYEPLIEVTHNHKPEETRFIIEDNGIGISTDEYLVLKKIGYSTSHMDGERLGQFGMGYMSGFQLCGTQGVFNMRTRSFLTDETYSTANYITNFEYLDGLREKYGTRFEFPAFCEKASDINVRQKVEEFTEGMRVTVLYREKDHDGQEIFNEDYTPKDLADDYADDSLVITFENEYFEAVMSPDRPVDRDLATYNISMPIRRNIGSSGRRGRSTTPKLDAPWKWDFRGKAENGPIVKSDDSVVGLAPVSDSKYDKLPDERKEKFIRRSEVPDDAIVMPSPASSRDSYESGHREFWRHVSQCLSDAWSEEVAERIDALDDFNDFKQLESREKSVVVRGYGDFGPKYSENDPDTVVETLEDNLSITVDKPVAEKLDRLSHSVRIVPRDATNPSHKTETKKRRIWKIIDDVSGNDGTVYMGKTVSRKKAEIAWALNDNNVVVRIDPDDLTTKERYQQLEEMWNWEKLKDLPSRNLKQKLPDLPDDVADKYENTSSKQLKQQSSSTRTSRDPKTKSLKVYGNKRQSRRGFSTQRAEKIYDRLDAGKELKAGYSRVDKVIIHDANEIKRRKAKRDIEKGASLGVIVAPKYVYNYLKEADNVYESQEKLREEEAKNATVELSGDREVHIQSIPDDELILLDADKLRKWFKDSRDSLREWFEDARGRDFGNVTFLSSSEFTQYNFIDPDGGTILRFGRYRGYGERFSHPDHGKMDEDSIVSAILAPDDLDWDHEFMKTINRRGSIEGNAEKMMTVVKYLKKHDALPTK